MEKFMAEYNMQCPMAAKRLIYSGMPATVEHGKPRCVTVSPLCSILRSASAYHIHQWVFGGFWLI